MKKYILTGVLLFIVNIGFCKACCWDLNFEIPLIEIPEIVNENFDKVGNVAESGEADYNNAIGIARGITISQAYEIALKNPSITYFFFTKGCQMVLCNERGNRIFHYGDVVFFSGKPTWDSASGLADGYVKKYDQNIVSQK